MTTSLPSPPNHRVLVVDDSTAIHNDFRKILKAEEQEVDAFEASVFGATNSQPAESPFDLDFASQGQQAFELVQRASAEKRPYAMAFMDVRMPPGWDGVETTARIWEVDPDLQIVICTAYSDYSWDNMISRLGRSDRLVILKKPFDSVEVMQLANSLTSKWGLLQQTRLTVADLERTVQARTIELRESHAEMEMLLTSVSAAIIGLDAESKVMRWNRASALLFDVPAAQAVGRPVEELLAMLEPGRISGALQQCRASRSPVELHGLVLRRPDAKDTFLHLVLTPSHSGDDSRLDVALLATDITSHRTLESQLRQAQKLEAIGQLAAGIAHEINTPIQYIGDNTRFLKDACAKLTAAFRSFETLLTAAKGNTVSPALLARVERSLAEADLDYILSEAPTAMTQTLDGVDRVATIVRAMKEFSHPGSKEKAPADLNKAVETTVTVARNEWKYVADVTLDLDRTLPAVPCFIADINQCVLNLLVNSAHTIADVVAKSPGSKGSITVRTRRDGTHAELRVTDTGAGIPESIRQKIFEPFFTTKGVGKGTGQGLYLAYQTIVEKHQGSISFESEAGKGTTFIIRLPFSQRPAASN